MSRRRKNIRTDNSGRVYWITVAVVVGLFVFACEVDANDDPGAYLVVCPRGTERGMTCFP